MGKKYYFVSDLQGVMQILKETCKLLQRNKTIFLFITLTTTTIYFLLLFANIFSLLFLLQNLSSVAISFLQMDPKAPEYLKQVFKIEEKTLLIILLEFFFLLLMTMFTLLSMASTVYVSAMSYLGKDLTLRELCLYVKQIWVRPLVTWFYAILMSLGLLLLLLPEYVFLVLERGSLIMLAVGIILLIFVVILGFYLSLVLQVGLVTSVLEDLRGLEALGKAVRLISGKKRIGFILMFISMVPSNMVSSIISTNNGRPIASQFLIIFLALIFQMLVTIWSIMTFTVYYFECKEIHGEQVEFHEEMGYTEVSAIPPSV